MKFNISLISDLKSEIRNEKNPKVKIKLSKVDEKVIIMISDNDGEISINIIDKIFEPDFMEKEKDFGFGLFIAKNIIEKKMNGKLSAKNAKEGAEFRIEV